MSLSLSCTLFAPVVFAELNAEVAASLEEEKEKRLAAGALLSLRGVCGHITLVVSSVVRAVGCPMSSSLSTCWRNVFLVARCCAVLYCAANAAAAKRAARASAAPATPSANPGAGKGAKSAKKSKKKKSKKSKKKKQRTQ